jgi:hypothetical protein
LIAALCIRKHFIRKKSTIDQALTARPTYGSQRVLIGDVVAARDSFERNPRLCHHFRMSISFQVRQLYNH